MFTMCSELTPRARIPDTRIPQLMQPCSASDFLLMYLYSLSTDNISGGGGALCLRSFQARFPHPNLPPLFPIFHTGKKNFANKIKLCKLFPTPTSHHYFQYFTQAKTFQINHHQSSNIKVSYYDKLLDACEHVAVKRGRAPLIREVFSH